MHFAHNLRPILWNLLLSQWTNAGVHVLKAVKSVCPGTLSFLFEQVAMEQKQAKSSTDRKGFADSSSQYEFSLH